MDMVEKLKNFDTTKGNNNEDGLSRLQKYLHLKRLYSTVTDFARFLGWSTSVPLATAV